jgi:hypothetical protein
MIDAAIELIKPGVSTDQVARLWPAATAARRGRRLEDHLLSSLDRIVATVHNAR